MPKQTSQISLMLRPRKPGEPVGRWLYSALRADILDRRLRPGARIPATRDLAAQYALSRGTIVEAFERLKAEGYLAATVGSGTFVAQLAVDRLPGARALRPRAPAPRHPPRPLSAHGRRVQAFVSLEGSARAFRGNRPAVDLFPITLWTRLTARRLRQATTTLLLGHDPPGYGPLREAVADYLMTSRGVRAGPSQIAIVSGAQEALDLIARLFLDPGDRVAMEEPGYIGANLVFDAYGARVSPVPVDDQGMVLNHRALRNARLIYLTPAHQFPLGVSMSLARRLALLDVARSAGALIIEDDYDSEYRFAERPLPALQGLDQHGQVIFLGTFSKVLFPSLRLGYLVIPPDLVDRFAAAQSITTRHPPLLEQAVLADFISAGHFARHIRRMRDIYAERLSVLIDSAAERLAGRIEISRVEAGLQTVGWLAPGFDGEDVAKAASRREVEVTPLSRYHRTRTRREGLHLGFAAIDPPEIERGVRELAAALDEVGRVKGAS